MTADCPWHELQTEFKLNVNSMTSETARKSTLTLFKDHISSQLRSRDAHWRPRAPDDDPGTFKSEFGIRNRRFG